ncbi:28S ribosomal protein S18b-like protein [Leptotrombidium deliense]|uniref:Small ribosomal subunit protein mS40 n=1 Tax=Leptotrombidium deliense TaxID=299467 RepID=A0A443SBU5_9ACAR|nr:28S ribosomal protein S18b-like protein [Leptotrombidium deliense]
MDSKTYKQNYGEWKVWELYRRQHGRQEYRVWRTTRVSCIGDDGYIKYASPCPICRDRFLVLHYRNVKLISQFISPFTGEILEPIKTNLCQHKHDELLVAFYLAKDYGTLPFHISTVQYDYSLYYPEEDIKGLDLPKIEEKQPIALHEDEDEVMKRIRSIEEYGYWHKHSYISHP